MSERSKIYAGVGTRDAPRWAIEWAEGAAQELYHRGYVLRSGAARGMDQAFERGHDFARAQANGPMRKEIWLPEKGFEGSDSELYNIHRDAYHIAKRIHPNWKACDEFSRNAHARNCHQVLGADLNTPVDFVLCYTQGGEEIGGTRTAIVLAAELGIPVFNFGKPNTQVDDLISFLEQETNENA